MWPAVGDDLYVCTVWIKYTEKQVLVTERAVQLSKWFFNWDTEFKLYRREICDVGRGTS